MERLKQRIRQSPDELRYNVRTAEERLQKAKAELEEKEKVLAAQVKKRNEMLSIEEDLQQAMTAMKQVEAELAKSRKEHAELQAISQDLGGNESELAELQFQHKQMAQKIEVDVARAERLRVALEQKRGIWEKRNTELDDELRNALVDKGHKMKEANEKEKSCREIEKQVSRSPRAIDDNARSVCSRDLLCPRAQIEEITLKHRAHVLKMQEEKESLSRMADTYMHQISQSLGIAV